MFGWKTSNKPRVHIDKILKYCKKIVKDNSLDISLSVDKC